jgi:hypothetical protein
MNISPSTINIVEVEMNPNLKKIDIMKEKKGGLLQS